MKSIISLLLIFLSFIISNDKLSAHMFWNRACSFSGNANSYISRGSSASLNITGSFSIEAWINPSAAGQTQTILQKKEGGDPVGYGIFLFNGKVAIRTNANTRLVGRTIIPANTWTHIEASYESTTNLFAISINGSSDTTATVANAAPLGSPDSVYVGNGFNGPFHGMLDEVRIWNRALATPTFSLLRRTSLGTSTGYYKGLVLSLTFQFRSSSGNPFTLEDQTENANHFINRGVTSVDLSNEPSTTIGLNDCIDLSGTNEYLAAPDASTFSPVFNLTIEAWIYPRTITSSNYIIHKGSDNGVTTNYALLLSNGYLQAKINNQTVLTSAEAIPLNRWTHVAFTRNGLTGSAKFYVNGILSDSAPGGFLQIINGNDSLYVGGTQTLNCFDGYIDELRIKSVEKPASEINQFLFTSIDESNDLSGSEAVYNFDGYTVSSTGVTSRLYARNLVSFGHSGFSFAQPQSPVNRADALNFTNGFYLKSADRRIPASGTTGLMNEDTLQINYNEVLGDINVFVALNHITESDLTITLYAPSGQSAVLYSHQGMLSNSGNVITVFDDNAANSMGNFSYISFDPTVKPSGNLNSIFSGINTYGNWRLVISDNDPGDTGRLYAWGIQINNSATKKLTLESSFLIQGFYNQISNATVTDTIKINLRSNTSPYAIVDSTKRRFSSNGFVLAPFDNAASGQSYYLQLLHRNAVETWSAVPVFFDPLTAQADYDFTTSMDRAYGSNMIEIDTSPLEHAIFSGDVNKDGVVDLSDIVDIYNDANNFAAGYLVTDVTGDNFVDLSDLSITVNNSTMFIGVVRP